MRISYNEFIERLSEFVGKKVILNATSKITNRTHNFVRKVWDNKEFGKQAADSIFIINFVEIQ